MSRNLHEYKENERNPSTKIPSQIRKTVFAGVKCGLLPLTAQRFLSIVYLGIRTWDPDETYGR